MPDKDDLAPSGDRTGDDRPAGRLTAVDLARRATRVGATGGGVALAATEAVGPASSGITAPGDLGRLVREARRQRGMSQREFADLAGVGRRFLSELENGKETVEFGKVLQVTAAAGIDLTARRR